MAFINTLDSLKKSLNIQEPIDTSNFVTTVALKTRLAKSVEKAIRVDPNNSGDYWINPNEGSIFLVPLTRDGYIEIDDVDDDYAGEENSISEDGYGTGAVLSIILLPGDYVISWPFNVIWSDGSAPNASENSLVVVTLIYTDTGIWIGGATSIDTSSLNGN